MTPDYDPEIDTTDLCYDAEKDKYWQCISEMKWVINLGRIDIMYATIVISQYCPDHCKGHLSKIQHLYDYLKKYTSTSINFNTEMTAYDDFNMIKGNWGNLYDR